MKKHILTCFLAQLCLYGSTLTAQVAGSPGADFLHRSVPHVSTDTGDTHRGGGTLSDTLPEDFDLVDHSGAQGQEDGSPSALSEKDIVLYLELPYDQAPDTLWLSYWPELLKDHVEVTPGVKIPLPASSGNFFNGNAGYRSYSWAPPSGDSARYFSISSGKTYLFRYWMVFPEDQVRIRMDLDKGQTLFTGPSAEFFKAQMQLSALSGEMELLAHPLMVTGDPQRTLSDSLARHLYQASRHMPQALFPTMQFLIPRQNEEALLDSLLSKPLSRAPIIRELPNLLNKLTSGQQIALSQRAWGLLLKQVLARVKLTQSSLNSSPYKDTYQDWIAEVPRFESSRTFDPLYTQGIYDIVQVEAKLNHSSLSDQIRGLPQGMKDRIIGLYLLLNYKQMENDQQAKAGEWQHEIVTPWIHRLVINQQSNYQKGAALHQSTLQGLDGKPFDLENLRGKSLVLSFWITGCKFCIHYYEETLRPAFEHFKGRQDVVFVSINADNTDRLWIQSVDTESYSHPGMIQLHQDGGTGILEEFKIASFPQKLLVSPDFSLFQLTITQYSATDLIRKIEEMTEETYTNPAPKSPSL